MKLIMRYLTPILIVLFVITGFATAKTVYVKGLMKITMRTGPGQDHKIIAMLKSGDRLEMLDSKDGWSNVQNSRGAQGWVLTRFITENAPVALIVNMLKQENKDLTEKLENLKKQNMDLGARAKQSKTIENSYYRLKKESANFLILEKKYKKTAGLSEKQQARISALEKQLRNSYIKWFLSGGGVLFIGIFLGMSSGKKRRTSLI